MIETRALTKKYKTQIAVDGLNLTIPRGQIYGFLGPNGAGKTSTIRMLLGTIPPTSGEIFLFDEPMDSGRMDLRKRIGIVPEKHPVGVWQWMTGLEYLRFFGDLFGVPHLEERINALLERVDLSEARSQQISVYSRGMMQKLSFVRALLHDPDILFLDEPVSGLDPVGIKQIRDLVVAENREGRTIFVSSHMLSEMERVCDRVAIIYRGRLLAEDDMNSLLQRLSSDREIIIETDGPSAGLVVDLEELDYVISARLVDGSLQIRTSKEVDRRRDLSKFLISKGLIPVRIEEKLLSLEDAFMTITGDNIGLFSNTEERQ